MFHQYNCVVFDHFFQECTCNMNNMLVKDPYHTLSNNVCITRNDFAFEKPLDKNLNPLLSRNAGF